MELFTRNPETGRLMYHNYVGEIMFNNILGGVDNEKDMKRVIRNLCNNLSIVVQNWYSDHDKEADCYIDLDIDIMEE